MSQAEGREIEAIGFLEMKRSKSSLVSRACFSAELLHGGKEHTREETQSNSDAQL